MRSVIVLFMLMISASVQAQLEIKSYSASLFLEGLTHPGLKMAITTELKGWEKTKVKRNGEEKLQARSFDLSPSIGFFFHRRYQTGVFFLTEVQYSKVNENGSSFSVGLGGGYMRTIIPHTFEVTPEGRVNRVTAGHNYLLTSVSAQFGKRLGDSATDIFLKPQLLYALPNFPKGVAYMAVESGIKYTLNK